ncbi:RNA-directed DNA polymerase, eukaryota [Tanacetum coccineum]
MVAELYVTNNLKKVMEERGNVIKDKETIELQPQKKGTELSNLVAKEKETTTSCVPTTLLFSHIVVLEVRNHARHKLFAFGGFGAMRRNVSEGRPTQVSHSIFVANFPSGTSARQLWDICEQYAAVFNIDRTHKVDKVTEDKPVMVIDDDLLIEKNLELNLVAKIKAFDSLPNLCILFNDEGFDNVIIRYLGGFWVALEFVDAHEFMVEERVSWVDVEGVPSVAWTNKTFTKFIKRWGELLCVEDPDDNNLWRKRLCVVTKSEDFIMESFKIIIKGKMSVIIVRKIIGWNPKFVEENSKSSSDEKSEDSLSDNDICSSVQGKGNEESEINKDLDNNIGITREEESDDPFGIYNLLNHKDKSKSGEPLEVSNKPMQERSNMEKEQQSEGAMSSGKGVRGSDKDSSLSRGECLRISSSAKKIDEFVKIGQAMGFAMDGCLSLGPKAKKQWVKELCSQNKVSFLLLQVTKMEVIDEMVVRSVWGNMDFEFSFSPSVVYAPQELFEKRMHWNYLQGVLNRWHGEVIVMGYVNEAIDKQIDKNGGQIDLLNARRDLWKNLRDLETLREKDLVQRAKVKWAIKGDENSKYFHGIVNKKIHQRAIRGVLINGEWVMDPSKRCFLFSKPIPTSHVRRGDFRGRDKKVVWDCGRDKSPRPDGYTFEFIRKFWVVISVDICRAVKYFFRPGSFPKGCNSSFIALIPKVNDAKFVMDFCPTSLIRCQYKIVGKILASKLCLVIDNLVSKEHSTFIHGQQILDGPMILSEVIHWCNQKKKNAMIFEVDFKKAYDSVWWDFLDMIMCQFGFGDTWRGWIKGCLNSSTASVLLNESPTHEFSFQQGLRQGDPLSPFLVMLVMESLHILFVRAMEAGFFKGIQVGSFESSHISHLFYDDDAVFIGEWKEENLRHLVCILQSFYLASGLRINIQKYNLTGVCGVEFDEISRGATLIGCDASKLPFKYLGVMAGSNMARIHSWDLIIDKVVVRMSKWKAKSLSISGKFTLTKLVLSTIPLFYFSIFKVPMGVLKRLESYRSSFLRGVVPGDRKIAWFSWEKVVASKDVGGLGMSSFFAMNRAFLFKWIWRFKYHLEALWVLVIKAIHGSSGNLDRDISVGKSSIWLDCIRSMFQLKDRGVDLYSCMNKVGNGNDSY